jgi:hypothetical protein
LVTTNLLICRERTRSRLTLSRGGNTDGALAEALYCSRMPETEPPFPSRPSNESPYLVFKGSDLTIEGDPSSDEQFALTFDVLENLTDYLGEFDLWPELEPQMVKEELAHFNGWYAHDHPTVEGDAVTLPDLHALSLRRLLAAEETHGALPADYEGFVVLHAAIVLALKHEQEIDRRMQASPLGMEGEELPF